MTAPADKQYNELAARLARLETLLESNDALAPPGAVTLDDLDLGPALTFDVPTYDQYLQQAAEPDIRWDPESYGFDSARYGDWQDQLQDENFGYGPSDSGIDAILARLANIETFLSGGSNDTNQSGALNAGQSIGGDGQTGSGGVGIPAGYGPVTIAVCVDGVTGTMSVLGTTPV